MHGAIEDGGGGVGHCGKWRLLTSMLLIQLAVSVGIVVVAILVYSVVHQRRAWRVASSCRLNQIESLIDEAMQAARKGACLQIQSPITPQYSARLLKYDMGDRRGGFLLILTDQESSEEETNGVSALLKRAGIAHRRAEDATDELVVDCGDDAALASAIVIDVFSTLWGVKEGESVNYRRRGLFAFSRDSTWIR